jgi:hypothetical protein
VGQYHHDAACTTSIIVGYCCPFRLPKADLPQWGVIGLQCLFSQGRLYHGLTFFSLVGIIAPLIQWTLHKQFRLDVFK